MLTDYEEVAHGRAGADDRHRDEIQSDAAGDALAPALFKQQLGRILRPRYHAGFCDSAITPAAARP